MTQILTFPGLGLEFELNRVAFYMPSFLGGFAVYWYGVIIALAFLVAILLATSRAKLFGVDADRAFDVILLSVLAGTFGARLYYMVFSWDEFGSVLDFFSTRNGGLAIYGGILFGSLAGIILSRVRRIKLLPMLDLASASLILGQAIGRWGNFVNIEAFGSNTSLPWGMTGPSIAAYLSANQAPLAAIGVTVDPAMPVHPTFLYESLWCFLGFFLLLFMTKRRRFDGQLTFLYLFWYGCGRFFIEGLRTDSLLLGNVRISQMVALLCVLVSAFLSLTILSRIKREGDSEFMKLYVNTEEGQSVLAGTFYPAKEQPAAATESEDAAATESEEGREEAPEPPAGELSQEEGSAGTEESTESEPDNRDAE